MACRLPGPRLGHPASATILPLLGNAILAKDRAAFRAAFAGLAGRLAAR